MRKGLVLLDIDGTLADDRHRVQFAVDKQWAEYFDPARMAADTLLEAGMKLAETYAPYAHIGYLTGRREDRRTVTEDWLDAHGFPPGRLVMRSFEDTMPLANFKERYVRKMVDTGFFDGVVLFDDDPEVIRFVQEQIGLDYGVLCTWSPKHQGMVKAAIA